MKEIVFAHLPFSYFTFDKSSIRRTAFKNPEVFLSTIEKWPLILDEAHKVPEIFDEIKGLIDERRIPGQFILSGSVKFSTKAGVRESLTGRSAHLYLDTMTLSETLQKNDQKQILEATLSDVHRYLERGGMPGVCFLRSNEERHTYWEEWLDTTCELDLKTFSKGKLSGDLARQIIEALALENHPEAHVLAKTLGVDTRRIQSHLEALKDLFIVREITPHPDSEQGKALYYLFDSGLAHHLNAGQSKKFESYFLNEYFFHAQQAGEKSKSRIHYFKSRGGFSANFLTKEQVFFFIEENAPSKHFMKTIKAAQNRFPRHQLVVFTNGGQVLGSSQSKFRMIPWQKVDQAF